MIKWFIWKTSSLTPIMSFHVFVSTPLGPWCPDETNTTEIMRCAEQLLKFVEPFKLITLTILPWDACQGRGTNGNYENILWSLFLWYLIIKMVQEYNGKCNEPCLPPLYNNCLEALRERIYMHHDMSVVLCTNCHML